MKTIGLVVIMSAICFAAPAYAQTYVAGSIGYIIPEKLETDIGVQGKLGEGASTTLALGHSFGVVRAEVEASYRVSDVGSVEGFGLSVQGTGEVSALSAMANIFIDPAFALGPLKPYVGAGAGVSRFRAQGVGAVAPALSSIASFSPVSGTETGFAYQGMAGFGIAAGRNGAFTIGYRYFATPGISARGPIVGEVDIEGVKIHAAEFGWRLTF